MGESIPVPGDSGQVRKDSIINQFSFVNGTIKFNALEGRLRQFPKTVDKDLGPNDPNQTFDDCRTIEGWTDFIHKLLKAAWGTTSSQIDWVFTHDFNLLGNDPNQLKGIYVVYDVITEMPATQGSVVERKPRVREVIQDETKGTTYIWGQTFDVMIAFTIYADSWYNAIQYTEKFKKFMVSFAGAFKQLGLQELFYHGQMRDALYDPPHSQEFPTRTLFYKVKVERLYPINYVEIQQILIEAGVIDPVTGIADQSFEGLIEGSDSSEELPTS